MRYDAACRAVAEAKTLDEVKSLADKAEAVRAYAHQAKNRQLEVDAAEIRIRAERRLGELLVDTDLSAGGRPSKTKVIDVPEPEETGSDDSPVFDKSSAGARGAAERPTLADLGVDKKLSARAQKLAAVPADDFEARLGNWRDRVTNEGERVTVTLLKGAVGGRREKDFYPTPPAIIAELVRRWRPKAKAVWEPCCGDGRVADALYGAGHKVFAGDLAKGEDFFSYQTVQRIDGVALALCTNPPFDRVRAFIDHAFAIGVEEMALVLPERLWACGEGRQQFERHRPRVWANMDWREDYLGLGGSADRALAVAIWDCPCAEACTFDVWTRVAEAATAAVPESAAA